MMRRGEFLTLLTAAATAAGVDPVPGFPIGRCVRVLGVTAPEDARRVGFEYLELALQDLLPLPDFEFAAIVQRLRDNALPAISGYGFMPADLKVVGPGVDRAAVDRALRHGIARAAKLQLQMVVHGNLLTAARKAPDGFAITEARRQFADFAERAAKLAAGEGITVLIEPMPTRSTNVINTVAEALELVRTVHHHRLAILADFSFMTQGGEDYAILHTASPRIKQIEISNPNGRIYPAHENEADYTGFMKALRQGQYRGGFSIHGQPKVFAEDAPRAIAMLRGLAKQYLT
jgi:D-psicose/D-tagatose/L-ribulose 3-epimerase